MPGVEACMKRRIGDYHLDECEQHKLGEGAFGKVYRAEHAQSGIPVAVKKLAKERVKYDELHAVSKLNNENVIGIINLCGGAQENEEEQEFVFVILELCDTDLHVHLRNQDQGRLSPIDLDFITEGLARGYLALFERSIIHRDIKPENILLKYACNGRIRAVKIGDFGASRLMSPDNEDRKLTALAGTPLYMAPEIGANIVADRQYDARVDMWSMGVVLYECINGQVPFDERALCRLFLFSANSNYDGYSGPPHPWPTSASLCYEALIHRLLELDVTRRLSPQEFHCWIVHQQLLIDQTAVVEIHVDRHSDVTFNPKKRLFRLRGTNGCCQPAGAGVGVGEGQKNIGKGTLIMETNNNNEETADGHCTNCSSHVTGDLVHSKQAKTGIAMTNSNGSAVMGALERLFWFSGMFIACNYCCFSLRQYGYES